MGRILFILSFALVMTISYHFSSKRHIRWMACSDGVDAVCNSLFRAGGPLTKNPKKAGYNQALCQLHESERCDELFGK